MTEFDQIYKMYFNDVYLYLLKLSGNESIAEEITSETFFKALNAITNFVVIVIFAYGYAR